MPNEETQPAQDTEFRARNLPGTQAGESKGMLPGMAGIGMFMLFLSITYAFAVMHGHYGIGIQKYGLLTICTLVALGVFGMLRLKRWGWALVTGGCLFLAGAYFYAAQRGHESHYFLPSMFALVFFLYLVRTEVRERLR